MEKEVKQLKEMIGQDQERFYRLEKDLKTLKVK